MNDKTTPGAEETTSRQKQIFVPEQIHGQIKQLAATEHLSMSVLATALIELGLEQWNTMKTR